MLKVLIRKVSHECIFLPKFHCELNPIEMVCLTLCCRLADLLTMFLVQPVLGMGWTPAGKGILTNVAR
jgi:hypothetical protein